MEVPTDSAAEALEGQVEVRAAGLLVFRCRKTYAEQGSVGESKNDKAWTEFLMLKASYKPYHWSPPKGHIDEGESAVTAALRETEEEAGLRGDRLDVLQDFERTLYYEAHGKKKMTTYFLARLRLSAEAVRLSKEHTEFRWLRPEAAAEISGFPNFKSVLMDAADYIRERAWTDPSYM